MSYQEYARAMEDETSRNNLVRRLFCLCMIALLCLTAFAQEPITRLDFDTAEVYTMQRVSGYFKHPDGGDVALIVVRAQGTGAMYRVAMRMGTSKGSSRVK